MLYKFLNRHGIKSTKTAGERGDADLQAALDYCSDTIPEILENENITLQQLYNADETGLIYRKTTNRTYILSTEQQPSGRKQQKERVTLLIGSNADGTDKLPVIMIGKYGKPRCFNKVNPSSIPVTYFSQPKAWMDATIFKKIILEHYIPHIKNSLKKKGLPQRAVILVDNATSHDEIEKDGIKVKFLPPNTTSLIQPMDQGPIASLKKRYITAFMLAAMNRADDVDMKTFTKKWDLLKTALAIGTAWSQITPETLKNSWNKILKDTQTTTSDPDSQPGPSSDPEPVTSEVQEWIDEAVPTSNELTDEAIVEAILNPELEVLEEILDESEDESPDPIYTLAESITASDTLLRSLMSHNDFDSTDSLYFTSLIDRLKKKFQKIKKQSTLDKFFKRS